LVTKRIHYSRDIIFHEQHFPYLHVSSSDTVLPNTVFLPTIVPDYQPSTDVFASDVSGQVDTSAPSADTTSAHSPASASSPSAALYQPSVSSSLPLMSSQPIIQPQPRRSSRVSKAPTYLQDYQLPSTRHTTNSATATSTHWCNLVQFSALTSVQ